MQQKLITFAVPCYNSAAYMRHCIETLLSAGEQAEIILVDDGSVKDDTPAICDEYAAKYPTIVKAIHQENGGHGEGVNQGIRNATGLYYKVVDSDDWLDTDALKKVLERLTTLVARGTAPDLMICNYVYEHVEDGTSHTVRYTNVFPQNRLFDWVHVRRFRPDQNLLMHSVMYRTEVLRECGMVLPKHTFYVDNIFVYQPLPYVKSMYYMDLDLFKYFTKVQYLYNALAEKLFGADGASITDEDVQEFAEANSYTTAKHILLKTIDDSGKAIADDEKAAKKKTADKIAAQLKAVTDPQQRAELFDELMAENNEDTGENSYPHGYCFTSGSMVTEFEDACKELEPYEVSGVVESKYGYHIILRMPTQGDDLVMSSNGTSQTLRQLVAQQQLGSLVTGWVGEADVQWQPKFRTIDYAAVLTPKESFWRRLDIFDWFDQ